MRGCWLIILAVLALIATPTFAAAVNFAEVHDAQGPSVLAAIEPVLVSQMRVEVSQDVSLTTSGNVNSLEVKAMIPQEDSFQKIESMSVSEPYETVTDAYGNKMVKVTLTNPGRDVKFNVKTVVNVLRRNSASLPNSPLYSQPGSLVESGDKEIIGLAADTTAGESTDFEKIAAVAQWVNENIRYDLSYADVNLSAKATLKNRAGVCDEFSALTMAMLRSIGYRAGYIVGYAYGRGYKIADDFVAHGWVETCTPGGTCFPVDSTWGEAGWLDGAHIKFATLPESYYVEAAATAKGTGQILVNLNGVSTKITILGSKEEPLILGTASLLDGKVWNGYAVTKTDLSVDGCVYTKMRFGSCYREQGQFLVPDRNETGIAFCSKRPVFMPYRIPDDMDAASVYTCGLISSPNGGEQQTAEVTLDPREKTAEKIGLSVDRTAVKPGETVKAVSAGTELFTDKGHYNRDQLVITAPAKNFMIYAYKDGQLATQLITVAENRPIELQLTAPESVKLGEPINVSVEVRNIDDKERTVNVRLGSESKGGRLEAGKSVTYDFTFTPAETDSTVQAFAESDGFSTSTSAPIKVIKQEKNIIEQIIAAIMEWLDSMFGVH